MKKLFFLLFLGLPSSIFAQSLGSLNIASENGDDFYLFLDGKKQNDVARSNIRITAVPDLYYSAKIVFANAEIAPVLKSNLYVSDGEDIMHDTYYRIRREKPGKAKLVFHSMLTAQPNFVPTEGIYVFKFGQPSVSETMLVAEKIDVPAPVSAQVTLGSLNIFSQNGDKFFLFLNGVKQNETAQSNIRIQNVPALFYNVKIVFENKNFWPINKNNVFVSDEDDNLMDATYRIRRDKAGKPRFNFYSMTAINENFKAPAGMYVYNFGKTTPVIAPVAAPESTGDVAISKKTGAPIKGTISNVKVTVKDDANSKTHTTVKSITQKTTPPVKNTTTVTTGKSADKTTSVRKTEETAKSIPENKKCNGWPMGKGDLAVAKKTIEDAGKDDAKLSTAQEIIASNCLLASQVMEFCNLFKSEKSKLAFAKYAYRYTIDRKNYSEVNKALGLETSKKELSKFISGG